MNKRVTFDTPGGERNPLVGVPLIESPFFEEELQVLPLDEPTKAIARRLHQFGWAVIDFPDPEIDAVAERIKQSLQPLYDWAHWKSEGWRANDGLRIQDAYTFNPDVKRIAANPKILELLSALYGRRAWPFQTLNFPVGTQQHYHTDSVHFSSVPERYMCAIWVALEDIGPEQGPLVYYSGSHKWPLYVNEHIGFSRPRGAGAPSQRAYEKVWTRLVEVNKLEPEYFYAKKGQALIWAANLLHGGSHQTNPDLTRWSQVTHYYFDGCCYYTPMESDPFLGRIFYRRPRDISTGMVAQNTYAGQRVSSAFIWMMILNSIAPGRLLGELRRKVMSRFGP